VSHVPFHRARIIDSPALPRRNDRGLSVHRSNQQQRDLNHVCSASHLFPPFPLRMHAHKQKLRSFVCYSLSTCATRAISWYLLTVAHTYVLSFYPLILAYCLHITCLSLESLTPVSCRSAPVDARVSLTPVSCYPLTGLLIPSLLSCTNNQINQAWKPTSRVYFPCARLLFSLSWRIRVGWALEMSNLFLFVNPFKYLVPLAELFQKKR
jgi:hypothetical protein